MALRGKLSDSVKVCPKTGRPVKNKPVWKNPLIALPVAGFAALAWFCIRVIPKPSRIHHPCQQVALPLASGFLFWLASFAAGVAVFRTSLSLLKNRRFVVGAACLGAAVAFLAMSGIQSARPSEASIRKVVLAPLPCGVAKGIFPGRVVWARNLAAAKQTCTQAAGDYWWMDKNTDSTVVEKMVSDDLRALTGTNSDSAAWVALFKYFNKQRYGLDNTGYSAGEKIAIKINLSSAHDMTRGGGMTKGDCLDMTDTSPQIMRAILKQLINVVHAAQTDIYIGDPGKPFFDQFFTLVQPHFPKVNYIDVWGISGRMPAAATAQNVIFYSDRNLPNDLAGFPRQASDKIPQCFADARYLISLAPLKAHESAGLTACAKNHFGSQLGPNPFNGDQGGAWHLHYALPSNGGRPGYGVYRNLVDLMGHKDLGGKTIISVLDALWSGHTSTPNSPDKWKSMANTYPSSIFMSQDIVAIEAVGLDFLKEEYRAPNYTDTCYLYPTRVSRHRRLPVPGRRPGQLARQRRRQAVPRIRPRGRRHVYRQPRHVRPLEQCHRQAVFAEPGPGERQGHRAGCHRRHRRPRRCGSAGAAACKKQGRGPVFGERQAGCKDFAGFRDALRPCCAGRVHQPG